MWLSGPLYSQDLGDNQVEDDSGKVDPEALMVILCLSGGAPYLPGAGGHWEE